MYCIVDDVINTHLFDINPSHGSIPVPVLAKMTSPGRTGLNVVHLCTCLFCKPRPLHVRACWCRERVCHTSAMKGCHISLRIEL